MKINKSYIVTALVSVQLVLSIVAVNAAEVTLSKRLPDESGYKNRIIMNADFDIAEGNNEKSDVVLMVHGALAHGRMETISYMKQLLLEQGFNTLAINLSLGMSNRRGMFDCEQSHRHTNDNAVAEIDAWVKWLEQKGAEQIYLLGHSRGGAQVALYAKQQDASKVTAISLLAPAIKENTSVSGYEKRYQKKIEPILKQARSYFHSGRPHAVLKNIGLMTCRDTSATAESFLSYYDSLAAVDTVDNIKHIKTPIIVIVAGVDKVVPVLDKKIAHLMKNKNRSMAVIDGAGHMFRDLNADDAIDNVISFFKQF